MLTYTQCYSVIMEWTSKAVVTLMGEGSLPTPVVLF